MRVWSLKMAIFASFLHCLPNILHTWPHDSFHFTWMTWCDCRWPWRYFKVIKLFHIKFIVNGALYGKSLLQSTNRKSYTSFRLVLLLMTLKYIWRSFQPRLSFPRPFQQSLAGFRVARSPSNSSASCLCVNFKLATLGIKGFLLFRSSAGAHYV